MTTREQFDALRAQVRSDRDALQKATSNLRQSEAVLSQAEAQCRHQDDTATEFEEIIEPARTDAWGGFQDSRATGTYRKVTIKTCRLCGRVQKIVPPIF